MTQQINKVAYESIASGVCYTGQATLCRTDAGSEFLVVAADIPTLETVWDKLCLSDLDRSKIQAVAVAQIGKVNRRRNK